MGAKYSCVSSGTALKFQVSGKAVKALICCVSNEKEFRETHTAVDHSGNVLWIKSALHAYLCSVRLIGTYQYGRFWRG